MATTAPTDNLAYIYRLLTLNIDCGTAIVRNLIDDRCSNTTLPAVLAQEKRAIRHLLTNRILTKVHFDILYPQSGIPPTTADFDLTLAICLLRSLKFFGLNSKYTWNIPPQSGDISPEADLCRLRIYRNELAHISLTTGISETDFKTKWADIEGALHRLNGLVLHPIQNLQQIIDDCKTGPLFPEAEKVIEKEIIMLQKIEEKLVLNITKEVSELKKEIIDTKNEISEVREQVQNTTKDLRDSTGSFHFANDPRTRELYETAILQGKEKDTNVRVMVIGCYGQGKSSLVKCLTGQSIKDVESTNGIHICVCNSKDGSKYWDKKEDNDISTESVKRLVSIAMDGSLDIYQREISVKTLKAEPEYSNKGMEVEGSLRQEKKKKTTSKQIVHREKLEISIHSGSMTEPTKTSMTRSNVPTLQSIEFAKEIRIAERKKDSSEDDRLKISIWDFGGQFVYYATHQLFHSRQAIYLLVFNIAQDLNMQVKDEDCPLKQQGKTMKDYLKFWIDSVHTFAGNDQATEPHIFLVGTHLDKLQSNDDGEERFEEVREIFEDSKSAFHIQRQHFSVSNTKPSETTLDLIRTAVMDVAKEQTTERFIPALWIPLERSLIEQRHLKIVDFAVVQEIDNKNEIPVGSEEQIKLFLQFHHEKGNFFFFDCEGENTNYVVLEPQFLIDAFKCIITAGKFCRVDPSLRKLWNKLCNEAILEKELLHALWGKDPNTEFLKFEDVLLFFLQKHRILAEALKFENSGGCIQSRKLGFYIVPSLLRKSDSTTIGTFLKRKKYTKTSLGYVFEFDSVLATVFSRVTAAVLAKWPLLEFKGNPLIYENVAACKLTIDHAGLLILEKDSLELLVISLCPSDDVCNLNSDIFRRFVEMVIEQELNKFRRNDSEYHDSRTSPKFVRCYDKEHDCKGSLNVHDLDTLQRFTKTNIGCPDHESHSLVIQDVIHEWFKSEIADSDLPKRQLTEKELSKLSRGIGKDWEFLARQLDIPDVEIEHINEDKKTTASKIYESLKRWKTRKADEATLDVLVGAIQECRGFITIDDDILKDLIDGI